MAPLFLEAEKAAKASPRKEPSKTLVQFIEDVRADEKLSKAADFRDSNKIRDGILERAPKEMVHYASQYQITEDQLEEKTAEMISAAGKFSYCTRSQMHGRVSLT